MSTETNRPWISSFAFNTLPKSHKFDQLHKLSRNYIASLDLGCPSFKLVDQVDSGKYSKELNNRDKYLQWVENWKIIYNELSRIIRTYKTYRKMSSPEPFSRDEHLRLKETAQVLLNARHNAKLASWAIKHQSKCNSI